MSLPKIQLILADDASHRLERCELSVETMTEVAAWPCDYLGGAPALLLTCSRAGPATREAGALHTSTAAAPPPADAAGLLDDVPGRQVVEEGPDGAAAAAQPSGQDEASTPTKVQRVF